MRAKKDKENEEHHFAAEKVLLGALAPLARGTVHEQEITSLLQSSDATSSGSSTDTIIGSTFSTSSRQRERERGRDASDQSSNDDFDLKNQ